MNPPLRIDPLPAFVDNYLWLLQRGSRAVVVDPGDAAPVLAALASGGLELEAVLITHHHPDHIGGLARLQAAQPQPVPVYGPAAEAARIPGLSTLLQGGECLRLLEQDWQVLAVPGHTLGHLAYWAQPAGRAPLLLCGDTLFSAGCGRLFEGSPAQMAASLARLAALPAETEVYCTHEYTLSNLAFAEAVEPDHLPIRQHRARVQALRAAGQPSLPSTLAREQQINPFLRLDQPAVQAAARAQGAANDDAVSVFAALRAWKDRFRG